MRRIKFIRAKLMLVLVLLSFLLFASGQTESKDKGIKELEDHRILTLQPERLEYLTGEKIVFRGTLKASSGNPVPNFMIRVDDSLAMICTDGPYTDSFGNFHYETTAPKQAGGVYTLIFYGGASPVYCTICIKKFLSMSVINDLHHIKLGVTSNISDIDPVISAKIGSGIPLPDLTELMNTAKNIAVFMVGAGQEALVDFVSNPVKDLAALASVGCAVGAWTGVGTLPCSAIYGWTLIQGGKSLFWGFLTEIIDISDLPQDLKKIWKDIVKPGVKCVIGIATLDPERLTVLLDIGDYIWTGGQAIAGISKYANREVLHIAAVPSNQSERKVAVAVVVIPLEPLEVKAGTPEVIYPSAEGITWNCAETYTIRWCNFPGSHVGILLYKNWGLLMILTSSTPNDGSYSWTPWCALAPGSKYRIKIDTATGTLKDYRYDLSDNYFTISQPVAPEVKYPTEPGITWRCLDTYTIRWYGFPGPRVNIQLYKGSSLDWTIESEAINNGSYSWRVPVSQKTGSDFKIKITSTSDTSMVDYSNNTFTIKSRGPEVTYPSAEGITWKCGETYTIKWHKFTGRFVMIILYKGSRSSQTISFSTPNDGSYSWTPGCNLKPGSDYRVRIDSGVYGKDYEYDFSDYCFTILREDKR